MAGTSKVIKLPKGPRGPAGVCWQQDRRIQYNFVGAHCTLKTGHKGKHSWERPR